MRVFLYEHITGGGLWHCPGQEPAGSLLAEGAAMLRAVMADFAAIEGVEIATTRDVRLGKLPAARCIVVPIAAAKDEAEALVRLSSAADWTLLIAPETNGALVSRARLVESNGGRLMSPPSACVEIASSKQATAEWLRWRGVRAPQGILLSRGRCEVLTDFPFPAVVKPDDGCGSQGVRMIRLEHGGGQESISIETNPFGDPHFEIDSRPRSFRLEEFVAGLPASVAVLCGPAGLTALPACEQRLSRDGRFTYLGGRLPLAPKLDGRARRLALAAVRTLPQPRGYMGVDLILGDAEDGSGDCVIEINPRLTTSYVGLRALSRTNLAAAMLAAASGQGPDSCFADEPVEFTADGKISL